MRDKTREGGREKHKRIKRERERKGERERSITQHYIYRGLDPFPSTLEENLIPFGGVHGMKHLLNADPFFSAANRRHNWRKKRKRRRRRRREKK